MFYQTNQQSDTFALGQALGDHLVPGDSVLLKGDLGMGKSVLARGIASALGVDGPMPSPTFTLLIPYDARINVSHFDLYRLSDMDEFDAAGLDEYIGGDRVALIEWPLEGLRCAPSITLTLFRGAQDEARRITLTFDGMDAARQRVLMDAIAGWEERI